MSNFLYKCVPYNVWDIFILKLTCHLSKVQSYLGMLYFIWQLWVQITIFHPHPHHAPPPAAGATGGQRADEALVPADGPGSLTVGSAPSHKEQRPRRQQASWVPGCLCGETWGEGKTHMKHPRFQTLADEQASRSPSRMPPAGSSLYCISELVNTQEQLSAQNR